MKFDDFWSSLLTDLNIEKEFTTLERESKFYAHSAKNSNDEWVVFVTPRSSGIERGQILKNEFEGIWNNTKDRPNENRFVNDGGLNSYIKKDGTTGTSKNFSYISKLINYVVQEEKMT